MYELANAIPRPILARHQYERETRSIRVAVKPAYLDDQSDPDDGRYVWSYTVTIENRGAGAGAAAVALSGTSPTARAGCRKCAAPAWWAPSR